MLGEIGAAIAGVGAIISIYGTALNNINHDHEGALIVWMYSNLILLLWAIGNVAGYWDGGLGAIALVLMYGVYSLTNLYGLLSMSSPEEPEKEYV